MYNILLTSNEMKYWETDFSICCDTFYRIFYLHKQPKELHLLYSHEQFILLRATYEAELS